MSTCIKIHLKVHSLKQTALDKKKLPLRREKKNNDTSKNPIFGPTLSLALSESKWELKIPEMNLGMLPRSWRVLHGEISGSCRIIRFIYKKLVNFYYAF